MKLTKNINKNIFREYDIRGKYQDDINEDVAYTIGKSFGSYIKELGEADCIVGYDNRYSSVELSNALMRGISDTGIHVLCLGLVTTPMYYYAMINNDTSCGIMVTASHNPKDDNGFKIAFNKNGNAKGKEIQDFYKYTINGKFKDGYGLISYMDIKDLYIEYLLSNIKIEKPISVIIDCGNGTTTTIAPDVYNQENISLITLYGNSDPNFPNHHPDPAVDANLKVLKDAVVELKADVGIAFDGDGDRVGIVDNLGRIVRIDEVMALFVKDIVKNNTNHKFLYDVKCGMTLIKEIERQNAEGIMVRTGNSYTKSLTKENDCIFGGEYSGHVYFRDKFLGFDSGIYAGLRVVELLSKSNKTLSEMVDELEKFYSTDEIKISTTDTKKFKVIDKIKKYAKDKGYKFNEIDGIRVELEDAWVSVRASNTGPNITMRVEASTIEKRDELYNEFMKVVEKHNK